MYRTLFVPNINIDSKLLPMLLPLTLAAINFHGPFVVISRNQYDVPYNQQQDYTEHLIVIKRVGKSLSDSLFARVLRQRGMGEKNNKPDILFQGTSIGGIILKVGNTNCYLP